VTQFQNEKSYWRDVLKPVVETVKFLAERGLPFRGTDETFGSETNGNYLGILELIAKFDSFLCEHIKRFGGAGRGVTSYLSKTTCEEFIQLLAMKVEASIISEIKLAKYFSISVDSTPDVAHADQLTFIVRYVLPNGKPVERFIRFIELHGHGSENMEAVVTKLIEDLGLDVSNLRGQSYNNAANMSGIYSGLQARIRELNPLAHYVPCAAHSLYLVGSCAACSCLHATSYFALLQALYNFLSASTYRWQMLKDVLPPHGLVVKTLSDTRWSARADATRAVSSHYQEIVKVLGDICIDAKQTSDTRLQADGLIKQMEQLETALMTVIWHTILERFNTTSLSLQKVEIDLLSVVKLHDSLITFLLQMRDRFDEVEENAKSYVDVKEYKAATQRTKHANDFSMSHVHQIRN